MRTWTAVLALSAIAVLLSGVAHAHFALIEPASALAIEDGGKGAPPCAEGPASNIVTPVQGGHPLKIKLSEFVPHPGHYRIALSVHSRDELPPDPPVETQDGISISAPIQNPPQIPVLADGVFLHDGSGGVTEWQTDVVLPNINCEKCTLQIIELMIAHGFNAGGGYYYHHCADLRITADPNLGPPDIGWILNPIGPAGPSQYFAQFASGAGLSSSITLTNPSSTETARGVAGFFDDQGRPLAFPFKGQSPPASTLAFTIKPLGSIAFTTDALGALISGSARVTSTIRLAGVVQLASAITGTAAVGESIPLAASMTPVLRDASRGLNTGIAIHNAQSGPVDVTLSLKTLDGREVGGGAGSLRIAAGGHLAKFIDELFPAAATADFIGTLLTQATTSGGKVALTAIEMGRTAGEFAILPVAAIDPAGEQRVLFFPHIGDGSGFASSLWLLNPLTVAATGELRFLDDEGNPLFLNIGGRRSDRAPFTLPPLGATTITTDGVGALVSGWARASASDVLGGAAIAGSVTFADSQLGLAGIKAGTPGPGFITPVARIATSHLSTGVAVSSIGSAVTLSLTLRDTSGAVVPGGQAALQLRPNGHLARFIEELFPTAVTQEFEGTLTVMAQGGDVAVIALQMGSRPGEFTALPVEPLR